MLFKAFEGSSKEPLCPKQVQTEGRKMIFYELMDDRVKSIFEFSTQYHLLGRHPSVL